MAKRAIKIRKKWVIRPATKVKESERLYIRAKEKQKIVKESKQKTA